MNHSLRFAAGVIFLLAATFSRLHAQSEMITNPSFDDALNSWIPMNLQGATATFDVKQTDDGKHAVCITVPAVAEKRYYVQLDQSISAPMSASKTYLFSFRAKSNPATPIVITMGQRKGGEIWRQDQIALTDQWQDYTFQIIPTSDADSPFLNISGLAAVAGEYWFTNVSLKETAAAPAAATK